MYYHYSGAIIRGESFQGQYFSDGFAETGFVDCDLSNTTWVGAFLAEVWFTNTNLEKASFVGANFSSEVTFIDCNLRYAKFSGTKLHELLVKNCDLSYADFSECDEFPILVFKKCIFNDTIMPDGSLRSTDS